MPGLGTRAGDDHALPPPGTDRAPRGRPGFPRRRTVPRIAGGPSGLEERVLSGAGADDADLGHQCLRGGTPVNAIAGPRGSASAVTPSAGPEPPGCAPAVT